MAWSRVAWCPGGRIKLNANCPALAEFMASRAAPTEERA
jgi:hypothetical protein